MSAGWKNRPEGGARGTLIAMRWIVLRMPAWVSHALLWPITGYFVVVRAAERRASRRYLARVLNRPVRVTDTLRHFHTFARSILDRVALLRAESAASLPRVRVHGLEHLAMALAHGRGAMLFGSHLGSFESIRAAGLAQPHLAIRILMDHGHNATTTSVLHALNERARDSVIDIQDEPHRVMLRIHETLSAGGLVGLLADRALPGEATLPVTLLGGTVQLPVASFRLTSVLGAPVLLIFGLLREDGSYDVHFEPFADRIELRRAHRDADLRRWIERYAARLEARAREAPYNWFNFYDFWGADA